ncbi:hypothetical protein EUGRSUZ_G02895 [Eucalyptus grandis]|uniref:Uncharacterized protein n=2 Tax=Eucalyptus grandis TaxID=71139 RepID=A0ACC3K7G5_EUCGR|nr:hypothetical protein EUGRSUZ_G02895 [Eucalyptus grandis]
MRGCKLIRARKSKPIFEFNITSPASSPSFHPPSSSKTLLWTCNRPRRHIVFFSSSRDHSSHGVLELFFI